MNEHFPLIEREILGQPPELLKNQFVSLPQLETECRGDQDLWELFENMRNYCMRYAETVCRFQELALSGGVSFSGEERAEIEELRKNTHSATIDSIKILARALAGKGKDASWINQLPDRPTFMLFALLTAFEIASRKTEPETDVAYG